MQLLGNWLQKSFVCLTKKKYQLLKTVLQIISLFLTAHAHAENNLEELVYMLGKEFKCDLGKGKL